MPNSISNPFDSGFNGGTLITGTTAKTGSWYAVQVVADVVFSTLTGNLGGDTYAGVTFAAGTVIYGSFTAITLASGKVIAYSR